MDGRVPMSVALGVHLLRGAAESQVFFALYYLSLKPEEANLVAIAVSVWQARSA